MAAKTPEVGMGVTECLPSMRIAYTVIAVSKSGKQATVQRDTVTHTEDGPVFTPNPQGRIIRISLRSNNHWHAVGGKMDYWNSFAIDHRDDYVDLSM